MDTSDRNERLEFGHFLRQWRAIGGTGSGGFEHLEALYAQPHRAYHTAEHIAECLAWLDATSDLAARPAELALAIYFHDAVYEPAAPDNEGRSAELFEEHARAGRVPDSVRSRVTALILSTAGHEATEGDAALLSDIDLAILGASPRRYSRYEAAIRHEYGWVNETVYRAGRIRVLRGFLERTEIYRTAVLSKRLEVQARANLSEALDRLRPCPRALLRSQL